MLPEESIGERLVFTQQAEQQVLGLDVRGAELARLVAREKNYASGLFCVPFKHLILQSSSAPVYANCGSFSCQLTPDPHPMMRITRTMEP
jgi:hypothetical protein